MRKLTIAVSPVIALLLVNAFSWAQQRPPIQFIQVNGNTQAAQPAINIVGSGIVGSNDAVNRRVNITFPPGGGGSGTALAVQTIAGDEATPATADIWYNSVSGQLRFRWSGATDSIPRDSLVVKTTGSYPNPAWLTSLAGNKLTGAVEVQAASGGLSNSLVLRSSADQSVTLRASNLFAPNAALGIVWAGSNYFNFMAIDGNASFNATRPLYMAASGEFELAASKVAEGGNPAFTFRPDYYLADGLGTPADWLGPTKPLLRIRRGNITNDTLTELYDNAGRATWTNTDIGGNAATVSNGLYTTGAQTIIGAKTFATGADFSFDNAGNHIIKPAAQTVAGTNAYFLSFRGGDGAPADASTAGSAGGGFSIRSGVGGAASSARAGGTSGFVAIYPDVGGAGTATQAAGAGGYTLIYGGTAGAANGGPGGSGGTITLQGGNGTGNGNGGSLFLDAGIKAGTGVSGEINICHDYNLGLCSLIWIGKNGPAPVNFGILRAQSHYGIAAYDNQGYLKAVDTGAVGRVLSSNGDALPSWVDLSTIYEPIDADLTALAALDGTAGFLVKTGVNSYVRRTISGSTSVSVGNGNGQLADPVLSVPTGGIGATELASLGSAGSCGGATSSCALTFDADGRETARADTAIAIAADQVVSGTLACGLQPASTGDVTSSAGSCASTVVAIRGIPVAAAVGSAGAGEDEYCFKYDHGVGVALKVCGTGGGGSDATAIHSFPINSSAGAPVTGDVLCAVNLDGDPEPEEYQNCATAVCSANEAIWGQGSATPTCGTALTNGQLYVGRTGNTPTPATVGNSGCVAVTAGSGSLSIGTDLTCSPTWSGVHNFAAGALKVDNNSTTNAHVLASQATQARTWTFPDATDVAAGVALAQTLLNKTLDIPVIASFVNAIHNHQDAAGGGQLNAGSVFSAGSVPINRGGTNSSASLTGNRIMVSNAGATAIVEGNVYDWIIAEVTSSTTGGGSVDTPITIPAAQGSNGTNGFLVTDITFRVTQAPVGGGTVAVLAGTSAGGTQLLVSTNATTLGQVVGDITSELGTACASARQYNCYVDGGATLTLRVAAPSGTVSTALKGIWTVTGKRR